MALPLVGAPSAYLSFYCHLMTFPNARLLQINADSIAETRLEDTSHYQITTGILDQPEQYWKHLRGT